MKISLVQQNILWSNPAANIAHLEDILPAKSGSTDLILLPEMFTTGFATSAVGIAEEQPYSSLEWMKRKAASVGCAVAASIATREGNNYYNRFHFVKPDGSVCSYDKHHLFTYGGEHMRYTAGEERVVVEFRGVRFMLAVCYDLRFPVWLRGRGDYDALLVVASWPAVRRKAWDALLRARAIENQCYVAAVNRVGEDPSNAYNGGSVLIDPHGDDVVAASDGIEEIVEAEIDMNALQSFRGQFPVLNDADPYKLF